MIAPYVGLWALYRITESDAASINSKRQLDPNQGNKVRAGDEFPFLVARIWSESRTWERAPSQAVNGQVFIDGNFTYWATSRLQSDEPRDGHWYARSVEHNLAALVSGGYPLEYDGPGSEA